MERWGSRLSRRAFVLGAAAGLGLLAGCAVPFAQPVKPTRVARIGLLEAGSLDGTVPNFEALLQGLRDLGYIEGHNVTMSGDTPTGAPNDCQASPPR
jgi:hypothetical protein